ncbi:hypothetical protein LP417_34185 (plasmid) [Polaromonas sp. P1-6]|nr:hypothetical protein LP417_34185 [Polaromonas sp. P1-6]
MPFRLPEEFGLHCDDPYFEIETLAQPDRLYWMHHSEADWSAMLMLIQSQAPHRESWQSKAVESARLKANKKRPIELMGAYEQADNQESKGAPAKPVAPPQLDPVAQAAFQRFVRNALKFNPEGNNFAD